MGKTMGAELEVLSDLTTPWCVRVAVTLDVAEHIAAGTTNIGDLAAATGCDRESLLRVLRHLTARGVFEEAMAGEFRLNDCARPLLDPARRLSLDLAGIGGRMANIWSGLLFSVQTGRSSYQKVFGLPFWQDLDAHPEIAASHDELVGPAGHTFNDADAVLAGSRNSVRTVVDVGGGTGATLAGILRAQPQARGILVDLPRTVAGSAEVFSAAGVADRVRAVGQSYFEPLPPGADLYLLKGILRLNPDRAAVRILTRCAEAARPSGRILIINDISPDDASGGYPDLRRADVTSSLLLEMMVGGKNVRRRTISQFREIAGQAGLTVSSVEQHPSGSFIVECGPAPSAPACR
jgi:2,7-dihydroxy-5-methyl-1-naphthoate 7-O-methyltransferase